jgi:hypothetical protein
VSGISPVHSVRHVPGLYLSRTQPSRGWAKLCRAYSALSQTAPRNQTRNPRRRQKTIRCPTVKAKLNGQLDKWIWGRRAASAVSLSLSLRREINRRVVFEEPSVARHPLTNGLPPNLTRASKRFRSAIGAPQLSPRRKAWVQSHKKPEHRRCGTNSRRQIPTIPYRRVARFLILTRCEARFADDPPSHWEADPKTCGPLVPLPFARNLPPRPSQRLSVARDHNQMVFRRT